MNKSKTTRRAAAAATRVPSPTVRASAAVDDRPRLSVEDCDPRAVLDAIQDAWPPREPMPTEPVSGLCGFTWWDSLGWGPGDAPGLRCTLNAGHSGSLHRAVGRDGSTIAEHDEELSR